MKRFFVLMLMGILLLTACSAATGIEISNAWTRPTLKGNNGAVYFLLQNHSAGSDELTGISSDVAEAVEIHESTMEGDVMQMRQVSSFPIAGKKSIEFGPGGYHVMLIGVKQELTAGDVIQLTLHFKDHEDILLSVPVQEVAPGDSMGDH
jgi:copper(I)-binding protein